MDNIEKKTLKKNKNLNKKFISQILTKLNKQGAKKLVFYSQLILNLNNSV
jgi:hypothetical protein